jgi:diadenosine tetraphosphate (Ap4A) HIT family hydrolase
MNATILNFDYPDSLIMQYNHWAVLLRPKQTTLGSLVLAYIPDVENLSEISKDGFLEFGNIVKDIEQVLKNIFQYDKINYLTLMMVDKNVHMHVIPRYANSRTYHNKTYIDKGWPGVPDLSFKNGIKHKDYIELRDALVVSFKELNNGN